MDKHKINGLIRTAVAAIGGVTIATFVAWADSKGIAVPGAEEIVGIITGAVLIVGTAIWSWVSKSRKG